MTIGECIKELRTKAGKSQMKFSIDTGIDQKTISRVESNKASIIFSSLLNGMHNIGARMVLIDADGTEYEIEGVEE